jgi:hypothetical protein
MYNRFQCKFLRHYEASFPVSCTDYISNNNNWVTKVSNYHVPRKESFTLYIDITKIISSQDIITKNVSICYRD